MRRGRFEQAEGGTLFLDEIGDMPFDLQTRLLRVLSDGNFYRVGGHVALKANVRVIAATHQDLEQRVKDGVFREDLFHRLNVIRLRLPSLRERIEDIPMLTHHFLQQSAQQLGVESKRIAESAIAVLQAFSFPGNVRQLENICHWLTVMAPAQTIEPKDLPPDVLQSVANSGLDIAALPAQSGLPGLNSISYSSGSPVAGATGVPGDAIHSNDSGSDSSSYKTNLSPSNLAANSIAAAQSAITNAGAVNPSSSSHFGADWQVGLEAQAMSLLVAGHQDVWEILCRRFESTLIQTALANTRGRRIEAAQKLGIGRNTITRKIQELGLE
jgi:two-component system nitrogen regulation response regulator GlnG